MRSPVTRYDTEFLDRVRQFVIALERDPTAHGLLEGAGLERAVLERGRYLVQETERAFDWEREQRAWNYISPQAEQREHEARYWHRDARRRRRQACWRAAETQLAQGHGLPALVRAVRSVLAAYSPRVWVNERCELQRELTRARGSRPDNAPLPKDTLLVELSGWYERWSLVARQLLREQPELLLALGVSVGRAPRRLRNQDESPTKLGGSRAEVVPEVFA